MSEMPKVFVLCDGERYEGHSPRSVHLTLDGAKRAADLQWERDLSRDWDEMGSGRAWMVAVGACDEAWIFEMEVSS